MQTIDNENICMFDVDDTLILWDRLCDKPGKGRIKIVDPYDNTTVYLKPHLRHIRLMKQMVGRGRYVGVWSGGGVQWAKAVIEALKLTEYVSLVQTKPQCYVDDLSADKWLTNLIYLKPDEN